MLHGGVQGVRSVVHLGGGNQFAYGEIFERTCAEDGNGIIDLGRGRTVRSSNLSGVSRTLRRPPPWRIKKKEISSSLDMENTMDKTFSRDYSKI